MDPQPFEAVSSREQDQRERDASCTPVERHAAVPQLEDLQGVEDHLRTVKDHIAETATEDNAQRRVEHEIVGLCAVHRGRWLGQQPQQIPPPGNDAGDIGQRVPADVERAYGDGYRAQSEAGECDMAIQGLYPACEKRRSSAPWVIPVRLKRRHP